MADKVKPLKIENAASGGTQNDGFPVETNPAQDYLAAKGIAFENDEVFLMDKSSDENIQVVTFQSTVFVKRHIPDDSKNYKNPEDHQFLLFNELKVSGMLTSDGDIIVME